jgi:hypothetical protein
MRVTYGDYQKGFFDPFCDVLTSGNISRVDYTECRTKPENLLTNSLYYSSERTYGHSTISPLYTVRAYCSYLIFYFRFDFLLHFTIFFSFYNGINFFCIF